MAAKLIRTESVKLSNEDVEEAIMNWLDKTYTSKNKTKWKLKMNVYSSSGEYGPSEHNVYTVTVLASRELPE